MSRPASVCTLAGSPLGSERSLAVGWALTAKGQPVDRPPWKGLCVVPKRPRHAVG